MDLFVPIESPIIPEAGSTALPSSVKTLSVTTTPEVFDNLVPLIHLTPSLQRVHLRGRQLGRSPLDEQAIHTLHSCKVKSLESTFDDQATNTVHSCNVKRLELTFDNQATNTVWHNMLRQPGAFETVEKLTVGFPENWMSPFCSSGATC